MTVHISLSSLQKLATLNLSSEQMAGVVGVLTVELNPPRSTAAERQARYRLRHAPSQCDVTSDATGYVTSPLARVEDNSNLPKEVSKILPLSPSKPLSCDPPGFENLWAIYPKRNGTSDRKGAIKAFGPALKRASLETILSAARTYSHDMSLKGKIGTEYVRQLRTWLNADGWTEYGPSTPITEGKKQVPVEVDTPAWIAWNTRRKYPVTDLHIGNTVKKGWYFPTEYPEPKLMKASA